MSLARIKTWIAGEKVASADLNAEFDNILANPTSLLSPLPAILAMGNNKVTGLAAGTALGDSVRYEDLVIAATQANQETGTSLLAFVTPGRQQYHQSACKGWGSADFAGAVSASYNLTSVTDTGNGYQTYVWAADFSSSDFCTVGCAVSAGFQAIRVTPGASAGSTDVRCYNSASTLADQTGTHVMAFGDQA